MIAQIDKKFGMAEYFGIRKLTPRECLNLTGFPKEFKMVVPKTEVYHQAGNSIVVNVIEALYKQMDITNFAK